MDPRKMKGIAEDALEALRTGEFEEFVRVAEQYDKARAGALNQDLGIVSDTQKDRWARKLKKNKPEF